MVAKETVGMLAGGLGVVIGFPVLYAGIFYQISPLTIAGFVIFGVGILVEPARRLAPQRTIPEAPSLSEAVGNSKGG